VEYHTIKKTTKNSINTILGNMKSFGWKLLGSKETYSGFQSST